MKRVYYYSERDLELMKKVAKSIDFGVSLDIIAALNESSTAIYHLQREKDIYKREVKKMVGDIMREMSRTNQEVKKPMIHKGFFFEYSDTVIDVCSDDIAAFRISIGLALDGVLRLLHRPEEHLRIHELCQRDHCHCNGECHACEENPELAYEAEKDEEHHHDHAGASIVKSALKHTAQVTVFIFIVTLLLNVVLETVGEDALAQILGSNSALSVVVAAIVGLIPNCAASVVIADLYVEGVLGAGAMFAGLLVSAGVGLLVLFRANRRPKQNLIIVAILLAVGIVTGAIVSAAGIVF